MRRVLLWPCDSQKGVVGDFLAMSGIVRICSGQSVPVLAKISLVKTPHQKNPKKPASERLAGFKLGAGVGFEPTTFRL